MPCSGHWGGTETRLLGQFGAFMGRPCLPAPGKGTGHSCFPCLGPWGGQEMGRFGGPSELFLLQTVCDTQDMYNHQELSFPRCCVQGLYCKGRSARPSTGQCCSICPGSGEGADWSSPSRSAHSPHCGALVLHSFWHRNWMVLQGLSGRGRSWHRQQAASLGTWLQTRGDSWRNTWPPSARLRAQLREHTHTTPGACASLCATALGKGPDSQGKTLKRGFYPGK